MLASTVSGITASLFGERMSEQWALQLPGTTTRWTNWKFLHDCSSFQVVTFAKRRDDG